MYGWYWCGPGPKRRHVWWWLEYYTGTTPIPPPPGIPRWYWFLELLRKGYRLPWLPYAHPPRDPREELEYLRSYKETLEKDLKELQDELKSIEERIKELEEKVKK